MGDSLHRQLDQVNFLWGFKAARPQMGKSKKLSWRKGEITGPTEAQRNTPLEEERNASQD